ncbi:hypothetical protein H0H93_011299 [Arthromyces matolae]|nr:hypothetical protein H0H93_011299 [Arthromyces matolae]
MLDIHLEKKRKENEENSKYRRRVFPTVSLPSQNWKFDEIVDNVEIKQFMERFSIKTTALHAELETILDIDLPIHNFLPWYMETTIRWWHENLSRGQLYTPRKLPNRVFVRTERYANGKDRTFYIGRDTWRVTNLPIPITAIQTTLVTNVLTNNIMNASSTVELLSAFISATKCGSNHLPRGVQQATDIFFTALEASFHRCHLVQTDISPNNILLDSNGEGVVNDYDFILN